MTHFTVNLTANDAFSSSFNCKFMHFAVYFAVKLHRSFNCKFTFIYNSAGHGGQEIFVEIKILN